MKIQYILLLSAILCALCADKLDKAFECHKKLRFVILVSAAGVSLICIISVLAQFLAK